MAFDSHSTKSPSWITGTMRVGIARQQLRVRLDVLEMQVELGAGPQHLAHVDRRSPAQDPERHEGYYFCRSMLLIRPSTMVTTIGARPRCRGRRSRSLVDGLADLHQ